MQRTDIRLVLSVTWIETNEVYGRDRDSNRYLSPKPNCKILLVG